MDISSSNYFSVSASTNKGMSGLVSGMDTESMVKQMLSGTQSKIDKQMGLKQQAEWRQDIYRDVISSINDFQAKYLDTTFGSTLKTNFASTTFFNSMISSVSGGDGVRIVSTGAGAAEGNTKVEVTQLAAASKLESGHTMSNGKIVGSVLTADALAAKLDKQVAFTVDDGSGGSPVAVSVNLNNITTEDGMVKALNDAFTAAGQDVKAEIFDDRLRLVSGDGVKVNVKADVVGETTALGLEMTGLGSYSTSSVTGADGNAQRLLQGGYVDAAAGPTFTVALDGVEKQITLNAAADMREKVLNESGIESSNPNYGKVTIDSVKDALQIELNKAFGDYVKVERSGDALALSTSYTDKGHELVVTGTDARVLGITPGSTSLLDTSTKLKDMGLVGDPPMGLAGDLFEFTINGEKFSFNGNTSIGSVMNTINNSSAGVRMTYSTLTDKFQMESTSTGKEYGIEIQQTKGDLLSVLFRKEDGTAMIGSASAVVSKELTVGQITGGKVAGDYSAESGATFKFSVDGVNYSFTLSKDAAGNKVSYNRQEIVDELNAQLGKTFGDKDTDGNVTTPHIQLTMDADGKMSLTVDNGKVVKFAQTSVDVYNDKALTEAKKTDLGLAMGFTVDGASNVATAETKAADVYQFRDIKSSFDDKILKNIGEVISTASYKDGRLVLTGTVPPLSTAQLEELIGSSTFPTLSDGKVTADAVKAGQDAKLKINGTETTRSSNTFTIDGITMEAVKAGGETTIGTKRDTETIVDGFKSFVDDYNALVKKLTELVDEKQNFRSYAPLTSEQKKEMSEREIELWEEKAKEGLLHRDSALDSFLSQMRLAMYTKPAGSKLALYNIGIETTKWEDKGQLDLDESALRNALATDPNSVMTLFTDKENGLGAMLNSIIKSAANPSSASPGTLVQIAGVEGWGSETNNNLSNSISSIASRIKDLQAKYESERARYWNQFSSMEKALANFNSQSSMISQQFSGGY